MFGINRIIFEYCFYPKQYLEELAKKTFLIERVIGGGVCELRYSYIIFDSGNNLWDIAGFTGIGYSKTKMNLITQLLQRKLKMDIPIIGNLHEFQINSLIRNFYP